MKKKSLLVIRFTDGAFVLEPTSNHVAGQQYKKEAVGFFGRLLRKRPKKLSFQEEAMEKLSSVLGFNHPDAIKNLPVFEYKGDEYHPVVLDLTIYFLSSEGILPHIKKRERAKVIPLTSHIHAEKLQKRLA